VGWFSDLPTRKLLYEGGRYEGTRPINRRKVLTTGESGANLVNLCQTTPTISVILLTVACERSMTGDNRRYHLFEIRTAPCAVGNTSGPEVGSGKAAVNLRRVLLQALSVGCIVKTTQIPATFAEQRVTQLSTSAGWILALIALIGLSGWAFRVNPFIAVLPGLETMKPNIAVAFLLAGSALIRRRH